MSTSIRKTHVTNSTGLSLNDRFTAFATTPTVQRHRSRSRSRSIQRPLVNAIDRATTMANRRLLQQLARRDKMQAAMKLKRRSMRNTGTATTTTAAGNALKRGSIKALRVSSNGRPIKANSLTNVATMKADYMGAIGGPARRPLRRSNSISQRLGARRPLVGGAAERINKRRMDRNNRGRTPNAGPIDDRSRGRSRSRSRVRQQQQQQPPIRQQPMRQQPLRQQQQQPLRQEPGNLRRGRSMSRGGRPPVGGNSNVRGGVRGRDRSRSRGRVAAANAGPKRALPIKARLGVRPGAGGNAAPAGRRRNVPATALGRRSGSVARRGVQQGGVVKRRPAVKLARATAQRVGGRVAQKGAVGVGGRVSRARGRTASVAAGGRSRSRNRKGSVGGQQQQLKSGGPVGGTVGRRGRSQQRNAPQQQVQQQQRNGKAKNGQQQKQQQQQQQQQRRGRSRSRNGRGNGGARGGRNLGKGGPKPQANRDDLDKELDQYMATTKTENDMDYLLRN